MMTIFLEKTKLSGSNKPLDTHILISWILHTGHLKSGQSRDLAHYKPMGDAEIAQFAT